MPKRLFRNTKAQLDWSLGVLALSLSLVIGSAGALWSLQQLRANVERDTRQDAQAMAQSVAQTLALQLGRAVRLGIPLAEIPGMPAYLERALEQAPGLLSIAVQTPDGSTLHATPARSATHEESTSIQVQGQSVGSVVVGTAPAALVQVQSSVYLLCALLVLALSLLSGWLAARGPGRSLERQRQQLLIGLGGAALPLDTTLPDLRHGGLARALHALAEGQQKIQEQDAAVQAYAQELLAVDFDQRLQGTIADIVSGVAIATQPQARS